MRRRISEFVAPGARLSNPRHTFPGSCSLDTHRVADHTLSELDGSRFEGGSPGLQSGERVPLRCFGTRESDGCEKTNKTRASARAYSQ